MIRKTVKVTIGEGLDARGVALIVQDAGHYQAEIHLTDGVRRMNAKSLMGMMALGAAFGNEVTVEVNGPDEEEAMESMISFLEGK